MKKRFKSLVVLSVLASLLTGCSGNGNRTVSDSSTPQGENIKKIGIVQIVEHPSLDTIRENILSGLAEAGYTEGQNLVVDYQNAQNNVPNLSTICDKFVRDEVDAVVAIATSSAQAAVVATKDTEIPVIFSAVTNPVAAKLVTDLEQPEGNVTGTSDAIPVEKVLELCKELTPDVKKIGFLYTASEVNSQSVVDEAITYLGDFGYSYEVMTITNTSELLQAAQSLLGKVDAVYTPIDNTIASAMPILAQAAKDAQKPLYVGADSLVKDGGYATIGINYENLGKQTGAMVAKVLNGTPISEIPVEVLNNFEKLINKTTAQTIGAPYESEGATIVE